MNEALVTRLYWAWMCEPRFDKDLPVDTLAWANFSMNYVTMQDYRLLVDLSTREEASVRAAVTMRVVEHHVQFRKVAA